MIVETSPKTRASRSRQPRTKWLIAVAIIATLAFVVGMTWIAIQAQ